MVWGGVGDGSDCVEGVLLPPLPPHTIHSYQIKSPTVPLGAAANFCYQIKSPTVPLGAAANFCSQLYMVEVEVM